MKNAKQDVKQAPAGFGKWFKRLKARLERRKAKADPETPSGYGKYKGWVS